MIEEVWKDIEGYEGYYQVSTHGYIKSFHFKKPQILKPIDREGYKYACLCIDQHRKTVPIHRIVAKAFIPNTQNKPNINHINFDTGDNSVFNLEWCTQSENVMHSYKHGRVNPPKYWLGKTSHNHHSSKEVIQMDMDGNYIQKYGSAHEAMRKTGIDNKYISRVARGERKHTHGYIFKYTG